MVSRYSRCSLMALKCVAASRIASRNPAELDRAGATPVKAEAAPPSARPRGISGPRPGRGPLCPGRSERQAAGCCGKTHHPFGTARHAAPSETDAALGAKVFVGQVGFRRRLLLLLVSCVCSKQALVVQKLVSVL